jgi:hypothetical protein
MTAISAQAFSELSRWEVEFQPLIVERLGEQAAQALPAEVRRQLEKLLGMMPDPGWRAPQMRAFSLAGALYIAYYLALKQHGLGAAEIWQLCEQGTRNHFLNQGRFHRRVLSWMMFSSLWKLLTRRLARRSLRQAVGGWRVEYVPQSGTEFDYGVTYRSCAIFQLAQDAGAVEFAPFICQADAVGSEVFAWGLRRTETLAQGGAGCDFRFRRGGSTEVRFRLPVISSG